MKLGLLVAFAVFAVAQQSARPPEGKRAAKSEAAQVSKQTDARSANEQPAKTMPSPFANNQHPSAEVQTPAPKASDDAEIQGKIKTFTGLLVVVGFLQFFALIGQVVIYCRQAKIMARQAHEAKRQRGYMRLQWKAMREQAGVMIGQLKEMEESRKIEIKTLVLQYRPKVIARFAKAYDFNVAELGQPAKGKVRFKIINVGGSPAYIIGGSVSLWSAEGPNLPHRNRVEIQKGIDVPMHEFTLQPGEESVWEEILSASVTNDIQWANYHEGIADGPSKSIFLVGTIWYRDDLNIPRQTGLNRKYNPGTGWFETDEESEGEYTD